MCASYAQGKIGRAVSLVKSDVFDKIRDEALKIAKNIHTYCNPDILDAVKRAGEYKDAITAFIDVIEMWFRDGKQEFLCRTGDYPARM